MQNLNGLRKNGLVLKVKESLALDLEGRIPLYQNGMKFIENYLHFSEAVDHMTSVSSKASDLDLSDTSDKNSVDDNDDVDESMSNHSSYDNFEINNGLYKSRRRSSLSVDSCREDSVASSSASVSNSANVNDMQETDQTDENEGRNRMKRKSPMTSVKFHPKATFETQITK